MSFVDLILLPGTLVCRRMGIEPESDQGLIPSMFNMLIYLVVILSVDIHVSARQPRVPVTHADIDKVVGKFYARVCGHPLLGPIFFSTISHDPDLWREHEAKIARFWANALLYENQYSGKLMMVHAGVSAIQPQHFDIWLGLFEQTLFEVLEQRTAQLWSELARRIGRGLKLGIE